MRKNMKIMMAAALTLVTFGASAQFGVKFGYANLSQKMKVIGVSLDPGSLNGVNAGVFYDIRIPVTGLSLRPGFNYTFASGKFLNSILDFTDGTSIKQIEHMISVPVDIKYGYGFNDFKVYGFAGPRAVVGLASTLKANGSKFNNFTGRSTGAEDTEDGDGGMFSRFDVRLGVGAGVQFKSLLFEVGYDWGMLNRLKNSEENVTWKMGQLFVGVGFMF